MIIVWGVPLEERADVWWSSVLRTQFRDGAMEVAWAEFVRLFRAKYIPEHLGEVFTLVLEERKEDRGRVLHSSCVRSEGSWTKVEHPAMRSEASPSRRAALEANLECLKSERADVWWSSVLRTQFGDGAMEVAWAEFVRLFRAKYIREHLGEVFALVLDERKEDRGRVLQSLCVRSHGFWTKVEHPATRSKASLSRRATLEANLERLKPVKGTALLPRRASSGFDLSLQKEG
ncbi:hypothetical protein Taro_033430 [Colocasia esculenta]|uniref:Retrotransposon gag domain-containing protein n=1 Tax=Colocasia esculenta TaxID=4460 RepID=A0A843VTU0_COLES|nr:hypothetical protein [Colocasia esculenta]